MSPALRRAQQGVVLFIALIVLVAMSLAGIALMRNVDTGTIIAGNLAFRQTSTHVGDFGVEAARSWLTGSGAATLYNDNPGSAYFATWQTTLDLVGNDASKPTKFQWDTASAIVTAPPAGYNVRYVIHRLCEGSGDPTGGGAHCVKATGAGAATGGSTKGAAVYGSYAISVPTNALYRITVRVIGPRNSLSFVQTTVY